MIKIIQGDILKAKEDIRAHQTNSVGIMGSGLAKQIKKIYPEAYEDYKKFCLSNTDVFGRTLISECKDGKYIAHLFGQYSYGTSKRHTNYDMLERALNILFYKSEVMNKNVAIPYNIGCCRGGGDWSVVYQIIERVFGENDVSIYRLDKG